MPSFQAFCCQQLQSALEIGDTGSDAWSTDVTASDNERLQDVDTDDTGSLARSDDTRFGHFNTIIQIVRPLLGNSGTFDQFQGYGCF